jgi:nucleoside-diphosphate-sugar epimerase
VKVLVTGGTGVVGRAAITELRDRGHTVRLLSRGAEEDAGAWDYGVEPFPGDVGDPAGVAGSATGCDALLHIVGIADESPPELTFDRINVGGTGTMLDEARRAGVRRVVFISSLGAERGSSDYHKSKIRAEELVQRFDGSWTILRTGAVVGPRDETVSVLLRMVRTLPAVPVIDDGDQPFQPIWHEDLAWAIAECVERADVAGSILRIAGEEVLTVNEVIELFGNITDRSPLRVPLPSLLAKVGTSLASLLGVETPVSAATVQMLLEGNVVRDGETNDLTTTLGFTPQPIRTRLVQLADELPEQTPDEGVGKLQRRRFRIDIRGSRYGARELFALFRDEFSDIAPFEAAAEPGSPTRIEAGATMTLELPARGHVQVRVVSLEECAVTLATIEGHPLAGVVHFHFADLSDGTLRFTIDVVERPASRIDQISMALVGTAAQKRTWKTTAENLLERSGGRSEDGVQEESWSLEDEAARPLEEWVRELVQNQE